MEQPTLSPGISVFSLVSAFISLVEEQPKSEHFWEAHL